MKIKIPLIVLSLMILTLQSCCTPSQVIGSVNNTLRPQETNNWCWAAVTQMIAQNEGVSLTQCHIANHRFGTTNCCDFRNEGESCPKTNDCNRPGWLELDFAGLKFSEVSTALSWASLTKSIACKKDVLGYAYGTRGVVGHVVAVKGYVVVGSDKYVVLNDPWRPCSGNERLISYEEYVDPAGSGTHWSTFYDITKK